MRIDELNTLILAVCPIDGINSSGEIFYNETATQQQKDAARAIMDANISSLIALNTKLG